MRNQQLLKLFLVLILSTTYLYSFSHYGALAYNSITNQDNHFADGTMIGSIPVAGKSANEAMQLVDEQLTKWLNETTLTLNYKEKSQQLDLSHFTFDVESTVSQAVNGGQNPIHVQLASLDDMLLSVSPTLSSDVLNIEDLKNELSRYAAMLETGNFEIRLEEFLLSMDETEPIIISESTIQSEFVEKELDLFDGKRIELGATSQFSLLQYVEEELGNVSALSLSKIATSIYEVILPTNFTVIERHISIELPAYASLGYEAKADIELNSDLVFSNPNEYSYIIEFEKKNDSLHVYLKGPEFLNSYIISPKDKETFKPKIIRQFNPQLGPTEIKVKVEGKEGQLIKVYREHQDEKGEIIKKELISEDFYPPIHQVEVQGLIIKEGNSTITPATEDEDEIGDSANSDSTNGEGDQTDPDNPSDDGNASESPTANKDDDLWGKENEIPK